MSIIQDSSVINGKECREKICYFVFYVEKYIPCIKWWFHLFQKNSLQNIFYDRSKYWWHATIKVKFCALNISWPILEMLSFKEPRVSWTLHYKLFWLNVYLIHKSPFVSVRVEHSSRFLLPSEKVNALVRFSLCKCVFVLSSLLV